MKQKTDNSENESKEEGNIQRLLEQNRINTEALKKLLSFIERKNIKEDKPSDISHEKVNINLNK
jgi:hypothetical protein